jgi:hypothetical protein
MGRAARWPLIPTPAHASVVRLAIRMGDVRSRNHSSHMVEDDHVMASHRNKVIYRLECSHLVVEFNTMLQGTCLFCYECQKVIPVEDVVIKEWRASCTYCRFSRWAGESMETANRRALNHQNLAGHQAQVTYEVNAYSLKERRRLVRSGAVAA